MKLSNFRIGSKNFTTILVCVLLSVIACDRVAPLVLPIDTFYYRPWQYLSGGQRFGIRHIDTSITMNAHGDLANMLGVKRYKQYRPVTFTLDSLGHRNARASETDSPDIVVVGHSFVAGVGNNDTDTLAAHIQDLYGSDRTVASYAPRNLSQIDFTTLSPRVVVWGIVERNLTSSGQEIREWAAVDESCTFPERDSYKDGVKKVLGPFAEYMQQSIVRKMMQQWYQELRFALTGGHHRRVVLSEDIPGMIYFSKSVSLLSKTADERGVNVIRQSLNNASRCLSERGISLIVVPLPDKAHAYSGVDSVVRTLTPDPLLEIIRVLRSDGLNVVSLTTQFMNRIKNGEELYWLDDTHWNPNGIHTAAEVIVQTIK